MKRLLFLVTAVLVLSWTCLAQTSADSAPATKEDIARYLNAIHSHDMAKNMAVAMSQGMQQMMHDLYLKHKDELPPDYEAKMTAHMSDMFEQMPWDDMMQAMVPVYQKHFTRGDIDHLVAFYASPTGEKMLREMPTILAESMQSMTPVMTKYLDTVQERLKRETNTMIAESRKTPTGTTAPQK